MIIDLLNFSITAIMIGIIVGWIFLIKSMLNSFKETPYLERFEKTKHENLEIAKERMLEARQQYLNYFKENPEAITKNVVFGELGRYEWYLMERKHLNHHFEQFNLIDN